MTARKLRATRIELRDVLGVEALEIRPGRVTVVSGPNGSGKSSILSAIQRALGRGSLAELARIDPKGQPTEPRVVIDLADDSGRQLVAERSGARPRLRERDAAGALRDVAQPQRAISALWDSAAANPVAFLQADPDQRIRLLYEALPLQLDAARLGAILQGLDVQRPPDGLHALAELAYLRGQVYDARTAANRDAAAKGQAADQIRRSAPATALEPADLEQIQAAAQELGLEVDRRARESAQLELEARKGAERELAEARAKADAELERTAAAITSELNAQVAEWRAELDRRITEARAAAGARIDEIRSGVESRKRAAETRRDQIVWAAEDARKERDEQLVDLRRELAQAQESATIAQESAKVAASAAALAAQAATFDAEAATLKAQSERLSEAIRALDEYLRSLGADLPEGLEVRGRELFVRGIPFSSVNTAEQIRVAVAVACLRARASELPLILVDGAEALDPQRFNELLDALEASGTQAIVAAVSPTPGAEGLSVEAVA